jgi:hypothetical protein
VARLRGDVAGHDLAGRRVEPIWPLQKTKSPTRIA